MKPATKAIHAAYHADSDNQPVVQPIHPSTIWTHTPNGLNFGADSFAYTRFRNPNRQEFERLMASLEGGETATAYSSGMAAIASIFQALSPGDHVVVCDDVYFGTRVILGGLLKRWGLTHTFVDARNPAEVASAITKKTRLVWLETPSNPMLYITNLREVSRLVRQAEVDLHGSPWLSEGGQASGSLSHGASDAGPERHIYICADNTWATPVLQRPFEHGADMVMHSCSKYIGGHSDILAGAVICHKQDAMSARILDNQRIGGAVLSPQDSWMLVRSAKTLFVRMRVHCENAAMVAKFLREHPRVELVFWPGFEDGEDYTVASSQMSDFGGMVSALFAWEKEKIVRGITESRLFKVATSLGGVESTWEHRQSSEGERSKTPVNLVRISVGIEDPSDLLEDLDRTLALMN